MQTGGAMEGSAYGNKGVEKKKVLDLTDIRIIEAKTERFQQTAEAIKKEQLNKLELKAKAENKEELARRLPKIMELLLAAEEVRNLSVLEGSDVGAAARMEEAESAIESCNNTIAEIQTQLLH